MSVENGKIDVSQQSEEEAALEAELTQVRVPARALPLTDDGDMACTSTTDRVRRGSEAHSHVLQLCHWARITIADRCTFADRATPHCRASARWRSLPMRRTLAKCWAVLA